MSEQDFWMILVQNARLECILMYFHTMDCQEIVNQNIENLRKDVFILLNRDIRHLQPGNRQKREQIKDTSILQSG